MNLVSFLVFVLIAFLVCKGSFKKQMGGGKAKYLAIGGVIVVGVSVGLYFFMRGNPTCKGFSCKGDTTLKHTPDKIKCKGDPCKVSECCDHKNSPPHGSSPPHGGGGGSHGGGGGSNGGGGGSHLQDHSNPQGGINGPKPYECNTCRKDNAEFGDCLNRLCKSTFTGPCSPACKQFLQRCLDTNASAFTVEHKSLATMRHVFNKCNLNLPSGLTVSQNHTHSQLQKKKILQMQERQRQERHRQKILQEQEKKCNDLDFKAIVSFQKILKNNKIRNADLISRLSACSDLTSECKNIKKNSCDKQAKDWDKTACKDISISQPIPGCPSDLSNSQCKDLPPVCKLTMQAYSQCDNMKSFNPFSGWENCKYKEGDHTPQPFKFDCNAYYKDANVPGNTQKFNAMVSQCKDSNGILNKTCPHICRTINATHRR